MYKNEQRERHCLVVNDFTVKTHVSVCFNPKVLHQKAVALLVSVLASYKLNP